jgi:hypothetical protein
VSALLQWGWALMCASLILTLAVVTYFLVGLLYLYAKLIYRLLTDR